MNCCSELEYRDDYSHCYWYASFERYRQAPSAGFRGGLLELSGGSISRGPPSAAARDYGCEIKTGRAFRTNLESIIESASALDVPVQLMTFASHIPADYSPSRFRNKELDYGEGLYKLGAELWGRPDCVAATLVVHNEIIRQLAARYELSLVDQDRLLPKDGGHFSDPCHLTTAGRAEFVDNMVGAIEYKSPRHDPSQFADTLPATLISPNQSRVPANTSL